MNFLQNKWFLKIPFSDRVLEVIFYMKKNISDWTLLKRGGLTSYLKKNWFDWTMEGGGGGKGVQPMSELFYFFFILRAPLISDIFPNLI